MSGEDTRQEDGSFTASLNKDGQWGYFATVPVQGSPAENGMLAEVKFEREFINLGSGSADHSDAPIYKPIKYIFGAEVAIDPENGEVTPIGRPIVRLDNALDSYTDAYGRIVNRRVAIMNQQNSFEQLGPYYVGISWSVLVTATYSYADRSQQSWSRTWKVENFQTYPGFGIQGNVQITPFPDWPE